ncbi:MAG: hypothetical protein L3J52_08855, partial [Proteobacteria bacterium]|nr:hypothetical protein [Pseudomonadota bacterium]
IKKANSNQKTPLFISNQLTQHIDLTPTVVSLLGLDPNNEHKFDGNDIFSPLAATKDKIITYYKPTTYPDFDDAEIYKVITNENNELTDLEFAGKFNAYFSKKD